MDTREELHAVLDELGSDELPDPEELRHALRHTQREDLPESLSALANLKSLQLAHLRLVEDLPESLSALANLESLQLAPLRLVVVHGLGGVGKSHIAALTAISALGRPMSSWAANPAHLEDAAHAQTGDPSPHQPHQIEYPPTDGVTEEEHVPRRPRKLPRSLGMGKNGPADLSEREGFAPPEVGERH